MNFNQYVPKIAVEKKSANSKILTNSTPRLFLSSNGQIGTRFSSYNSNDRYAKDDNIVKGNGFVTNKHIDAYSSNVITVPRVGPTYLSTNRLSYQHLINQIAQITDNVFLSGINAITIYRIRELGITMLVSLLTDPIPFRAPNLENVIVPIEDNEYSNLKSHLDRVIDKMNLEVLRGGKILVHCLAGVSRSSSLVIAYLMKYQTMTLREAYNHVRARRPYIQPNIGFWKQLISFEKRLFGSTSVKLVLNSDRITLSPDVTPSALESVMYDVKPKYSMLRRF